MLFHYSYKKLFNIFLIRILPSLFFLYIALWLGEVFWIATIALWVEAIVEVALRHLKGYCKINQEEITVIRLFFPKTMKIADIKRSFSYDGEWAFRNAEDEIRIHRNQIRKSQLNSFDEMINAIQLQTKQIHV